MVREYLEKTKQIYLQRKYDLTAKENELHMKIKEDIELIKLLEESNDPNYQSFTPREMNPYNQNKIKELQENQKVISEQIIQVRKDIYDVEIEIGEIDSVIRVARKNYATPKINELDSKNFKLAILQTQESERQRIARDLHDSTVQCLTSLVHKTELCMKLVEMDPIRCKLELSSTSKILKNIIEDERKMIYDLRPMSFDDIGFNITVERFLDKLKAASTVKYNFIVEGNPFEIDSVIAITLLRVIQEACSNSVKHGNAKQIDVKLSYLDDHIQLEVKDNGDGFELESIPNQTRDDNSGFGLSMMKERIYLLSGELKINSSKDNGCEIVVIVPIIKEDK